MVKQRDNAYYIEKLKGEKNWESYHVDLKAVLIKEGYWKFASGRVKKPIPPVLPTTYTSSSNDAAKAIAAGEQRNIISYWIITIPRRISLKKGMRVQWELYGSQRCQNPGHMWKTSAIQKMQLQSF